MAGWVYILSNPAMQNLLKIGYTDRDPFGRAKEISQATGVPFDFVVDYQIYVSHPYEVEQKTHRQLSKYRVNNNREFFQCSYEDAIYAIKEVISLYEKENDEFVFGSEVFYKFEKEKILDELDKKRRRLIKQKEIQRNQLLAEAEKKFKNDKFYLENSKKIKVQEIHKNHKESFFRRFVVNLAHLVTIIIAIVTSLALIAFVFFGFIGGGQLGVVSLSVAVYALYEFYKSYKSNFSLGFRIDKMFDAYLHQKLEQLDNDYKTQFDKLNVDYQNTIHQIQENTK
ncbi:GIY-YIG nuclease family protein [Avibacterium avium]|uniref:GIY-YIG nuclease family protein n=1 Tax=Avibacterium avium TaxID=751 RepID=UPI0039FC7578